MRSKLDDLSLVSKIDSSNMLGVVDNFPNAFTGRSREVGAEPKRPAVQRLVLMGMGGSASAGDVVSNWLSRDLQVPIFVQREPELPGYVNSKTLFVAISYSGDTSETLSAFRAAESRHASLVGVGTGGKLAGLCKAFRAPFVSVESSVAPRAALGQLIVALAAVLESYNLVRSTSREIAEAGRELAGLRGRVRAENPMERNPAKRLASQLLGRFLVVYSLQRMAAVARRFKNQLAENCKSVSKFDLLPESCHNEIEAWKTYPSRSLPLIVRDSQESKFESASIKAFKSIISQQTRVRPVEVMVPMRGRLSRLVGPIFFLDYVSVYLALLKQTNPTPTESIAKYKVLLKTS
jgi:glucose/mannose-6-phosphate isomerase